MPLDEDDARWALAEIGSKARRYALYQRYLDGDHPLAFATEKWRTAFGHVFRSFSMNLCPSVVGAFTDRMVITGWTGGSEEVGKAAALAWKTTRMTTLSEQTHDDLVGLGDAYVMVWPDATDTPTLWPQRSEVCAVRYDDERPGVAVLGAKVWPLAPSTGKPGETSPRHYRMNLYYQDRTERWVTAKEHTGLPTTAEARDWREATDRDGQPLPTVTNEEGVVPLFHQGHKARLGQAGISEVHSVIPTQDALNKSVLDLLVGADYAGLPQRWVVGAEEDEETDPSLSGNADVPRFRPGIDRLWALPDAAAKFGEFSQADLGQLIQVVDLMKMTMAQQKGIPPHAFMLQGGEPPSGESLKVAEARLVRAVKKIMGGTGYFWGDAMRLLLRQRGIGGSEEGQGGGDLMSLEPKWGDPETRNARTEAETVAIKVRDVGVSKAQGQRELGYEPEEIDAMQEEAKEEATAQGMGSVRGFDAGLVAGL